MEFHHKTQGTESVEQLGLELQKLCRRAFPAVAGKDLDRFLKGRFYQALHVKWQRKLGPPKPNESFHELYNRARMAERHEKQYDESFKNRKGAQSGRKVEKEEVSQPTKVDDKTSNKKSVPPKRKTRGIPVQERVCFACQKVGHMASDCPQLGKGSEAPGRTKAQAYAVGATMEGISSDKLTGLTVDELEKVLADRKLQEEISLCLPLKVQPMLYGRRERITWRWGRQCHWRFALKTYLWKLWSILEHSQPSYRELHYMQ